MTIDKIVKKDKGVEIEKKKTFDCPFYNCKTEKCSIAVNCHYQETKYCFIYGIYKLVGEV